MTFFISLTCLCWHSVTKTHIEKRAFLLIPHTYLKRQSKKNISISYFSNEFVMNFLWQKTNSDIVRPFSLMCRSLVFRFMKFWEQILVFFWKLNLKFFHFCSANNHPLLKLLQFRKRDTILFAVEKKNLIYSKKQRKNNF